jgi:exosortase
VATEATIRTPRSIPRELALALLFGGLFAASPLTSANRLKLSIAGGVMAAAGLFFYRWLAERSQPVTSLETATRSERDPALWVGALLFVILSLPAVMGLIPWYTESVWRNGHGLLLPLVILAVARAALHDLGPAPRDGRAWGLALLLPGLTLIILDAALHSLFLTVIGLTVAVAGFVVTFLGTRWARALAVPIGMILFFLPFSTAMAGMFNLPIATASGTEWVLRTIGFPVLRDTVSLSLPSGVTYGISIRCSGFGIVYGGAALSIALGALTRSWRRTLVLLAGTLLLAYVTNIARVAGLLAICEILQVLPPESGLHGFSGIAAYLASMAGLLLLAGRDARRRLIAG